MNIEKEDKNYRNQAIISSIVTSVFAFLMLMAIPFFLVFLISAGTSEVKLNLFQNIGLFIFVFTPFIFIIITIISISGSWIFYSKKNYKKQKLFMNIPGFYILSLILGLILYSFF